jgi:hypothetical protein
MINKEISMPEIKEEVVSINSENPDYYQWGKNCKILGYSLEETSKIIGTFNSNEKINSENFDLFWHGYYSIPTKEK